MGVTDALLVLFFATGILCGFLISLKKIRQTDDKLQTFGQSIRAHLDKEKDDAKRIGALEAKSKEAQALYTFLEKLSSSIEKETLMKRMGSVLLSISDASACRVYVSDERKNIVEVFKSEGKEYFECSVIQGDAEDVSFAELVAGQRFEPYLIQRENLHRGENSLWIPLSRNEKVCGFLLLEKYDSPERFTFQDEKLLHALGQHLVVTLENVRLYEDAIREGLTGLFIKRYFLLRLEEEVRRYIRYKASPFSVMMIDIDHFKRLNDTYGHLFGDEVLKGVAEILMSRLRSTDIAARFGGEEFSLMLVGIEKADAEKLAEALRAKIQDRAFYLNGDVSGEKVFTTASFGVACCPEDAESLEALLEKADAAMYRAKQEGRNRVAVCTAKAETEAAVENAQAPEKPQEPVEAVDPSAP